MDTSISRVIIETKGIWKLACRTYRRFILHELRHLIESPHVLLRKNLLHILSKAPVIRLGDEGNFKFNNGAPHPKPVVPKRPPT